MKRESTGDRIQRAFPITSEEFLRLEKQFDNLLHFASWKLLRGNEGGLHTEQEEDIYQELRIAMLKAASYYKRQTWVEACFKVLQENVLANHGEICGKTPLIRGRFQLEVERLSDRWSGRAHHKRGASFGEHEEQELKRLIERMPERPDCDTPLVIDAQFRTYAKSIIWNHEKQMGKRIGKEKPLRAGCVSLSENQHLSGLRI
jgi:hypothetical protein